MCICARTENLTITPQEKISEEILFFCLEGGLYNMYFAGSMGVKYGQLADETGPAKKW